MGGQGKDGVGLLPCADRYLLSERRDICSLSVVKKKMIRGPKMGGHRKTRLMSEEKLIKSRISVLFFFPLNVSALCCTHTI